MKFIDYLVTATEEAIEAVQWPFKKKMILRSFESLVDKVESERIKTQSKVVEKEKSLTRADSEEVCKSIIKEICNLQIELEENEKFAAVVQKEKEKLFDTDFAGTPETSTKKGK